MSELFVKHSLNSKKVVRIFVSFRYFVDKASSGDHIWTLELGTASLDLNGKKINPVRINNINVNSLDDIIGESVALIAAQIDWSPLEKDTRYPVITSIKPIGDKVPIGYNVVIKINDESPTSGIDLSELKILLDIGDTKFDITSEFKITGDPYEYILEWTPKLRINNTYR